MIGNVTLSVVPAAVEGCAAPSATPMASPRVRYDPIRCGLPRKVRFKKANPGSDDCSLCLT
jgi:hypothetical protein